MEALKALAREKNIDELDMLDKLEQQLAATYRRIMDLENDTRVVLDRETGRIYVYELVPVGGTEEEPIFEEHDITPKDVSPHRGAGGQERDHVLDPRGRT